MTQAGALSTPRERERPKAQPPPDGPMLLGVRHHGPGSARAVRAALEAYGPKVLLVEGPPEADGIVALAGEEGMRPPVALLAHVREDPGRAAFWPLAEFSPEWVAIRWALAEGVPVRFIDLPAAHSLALEAEPAGHGRDSDRAPEPAGPESAGPAPDKPEPAGPESAGPVPEKPEPEGPEADALEAGAGADAERGRGPGDGPEGELPEGPGLSGAGGALRVDPLAALAEAAGYDDAERWWEDVVEHRGPARAPGPPDDAGDGPVLGRPEGGGTGVVRSDSGPYAPFAVLGEAMSALRETHGDGGHSRDAVREAHMRLRLREAEREFGRESVAVVCGAWHVPALGAKTSVTADRRLLKGLPKVRAEVSWVPWTHKRLARHSGYGAGITSPGWYAHLFSAPDRPVERWMTRVAGLLRDEGHPVSSAHLIEAVRLADALAAMRGRPLPGLSETTDAVRSVLCEGSDVPLALIGERLVVGEVLGEVPEGAPAVPLQRDLTRQQRALRLKPGGGERELELDLRKETDSARSRLLHRLALLGVGWGVPAASRTAATGTFRESWRLCWEPELSVRVVEAAVWGPTVAEAATARAVARATEAGSLAEVTALAEQCLLADLPEALPVTMRVLADRAALDPDVGHLARALPALVRSVRYGDVRGTDSAALAEVAEGLAERVCVGLPHACTGLDAEGAAEMRGHIDAVQQAMALLAQPSPPPAQASSPSAGRSPRTRIEGHPPGPPPVDASVAGPESGDPGEGRRGGESPVRVRWRAVLRKLASHEPVPGLIRGRCARLLLDAGELPEGEAARLMGLALSAGTDPAVAAAWVEGFLAGGGMLLVHDERLLGLVDGWLAGVPEEAFTDVLPLLRRTFGEYAPGVRRTVGELVRRGPSGKDAAAASGPRPCASGSLPGFGAGLDETRAEAVRPTLRLLLGPVPVGGDGERRTAAPAGTPGEPPGEPHAEPHAATCGEAAGARDG